MIRKVMQKFLPGLSSHTFFFFVGHATQHELRDGLRFVTKEREIIAWRRRGKKHGMDIDEIIRLLMVDKQMLSLNFMHQVCSSS